MPGSDTFVMAALPKEDKAELAQLAQLSYQLARAAVDLAGLKVWRQEVEAIEREACRFPLSIIACGAGCSACCNQLVETQPFEVLLVHEHDPRAASRALANPGATVDRLATCPVLVDRDCGAHPARPSSCRAENSYSAPACSVEGGSHPFDAKVRAASFQSLGGAIQAFRERGLDCFPVILGYALAEIAGADSAALVSRWFSGEHLFSRRSQVSWSRHGKKALRVYGPPSTRNEGRRYAG